MSEQPRAEVLVDDLDELRRLAEAATPGPWRTGIGRFGVSALASERPALLLAEIRPDGTLPDTIFAERHADAAYIAAATPATILRLLDILAALVRAPASKDGPR